MDGVEEVGQEGGPGSILYAVADIWGRMKSQAFREIATRGFLCAASTLKCIFAGDIAARGFRSVPSTFKLANFDS